MFYNRVYYTVRKTYYNLKNRPVCSRKFITTNSGGGGGDPKMDSLLTMIFMGSCYYMISKCL